MHAIRHLDDAAWTHMQSPTSHKHGDPCLVLEDVEQQAALECWVLGRCGRARRERARSLLDSLLQVLSDVIRRCAVRGVVFCVVAALLLSDWPIGVRGRCSYPSLVAQSAGASGAPIRAGRVATTGISEACTAAGFQ